MEIQKKEHWGRQIDFILSIVGYNVGLGNIWRFPYLCMRNGGGAFLIPYVFFLLIAGMPLYMLEMSLGQFSAKSPLTVFEFCPLFQGLGWGMVILSLVFSLYYNHLITWILYYLGMSFTSWEPIWGKCDNAWNTPSCIVHGESNMTGNISFNILNTTDMIVLRNVSSYAPNNSTIKHVSAGEEFWQYNVLSLSSGIEHLGGLKWQLVICHFVSWILVLLCIIKGVKSSGKVVYVTATVPYIFLTALLIRGVTLPGSLDGIIYYIRPDFKKLLSFKIWGEACLQIFYSLAPCWGGIITMASYNKFHNNIQRDAVLLPFICCGTSFFAGFVIFSVIGYMAREANLPIKDVITSGPGLAFIAYPAALTKIPGAAIWSALFFMMLLCVGLDSMFVTAETCISAIVDKYSSKLRQRKTFVTLGFVSCFSMIGLIFVCKAGMYWFQLCDWYIGMFALIVIGILEPIIVSYIYGMERIFTDIETMLGYKPFVIWKGFWYFITPALLSIMLVYLLKGQVAPYYGSYQYPTWSIAVGWILAVAPIFPTLFFMIRYAASGKGTLLQRLKTACRPSKNWEQTKEMAEAAEMIDILNS